MEEKVKQLEMANALEEIGARVEKRHTKVDSTALIREIANAETDS